MKPIPYSTQWINDADVSAVSDVLRSDYLTQGEALQAFEDALAQATGAKYAVAVSNGTAALHLALLALGVKSGDLGITSPVTFAASANCFLYCNADIAFTDVDPETGLMEIGSLKDLLKTYSSEHPKGVIIPVSLEGRVPDLGAIRKIADEYGWSILEDAAHSLGAEYSVDGLNYKSGSCAHTEAAILSFHPVKNICAGEGGAVLTNDKAIADKVKSLRSHGIRRPEAEAKTSTIPTWFYEQVELGYNYRLSELHAALGLSQLKRLDDIIDKNRTLAQTYCETFAQEPFSDLFSVLPYGQAHAYHLFVIHFKEVGVRDLAHDYLKENGVLTQVHYVPVYKHPYYKQRYGLQEKSGAESYYAGCLTIPLFAKMSDIDQETVIEALRSFCNQPVPNLCVTRS